LTTLQELKDRPQPEWLIKGLFRAESQVVLYGPSGHGKSFVALDWALSIAAGQPWLGRNVKQGPVVYVVSEGGRGILKRVTAWMKEKGIEDIRSAFFLEDAVQMTNDDDINAFLEDLGVLRAFDHGNPKLIILDTFARSFVGGDENSAREMGIWIQASRRLQLATGAAVMAVHHTGKPNQSGSTTERGSSALRAAAETMIRVTLDDKKGVVTIKNDKQKEDEPFGPIRLQSKQVNVGYDEEGDPVTSLVLLPSPRATSAEDAERAAMPKDGRKDARGRGAALRCERAYIATLDDRGRNVSTGSGRSAPSDVSGWDESRAGTDGRSRRDAGGAHGR
jgi:RecA-family ATPase